MGLPFVVLGFYLSCYPLSAQDISTDQRQAEIAHKVVTITAKIKPGEVVVISGGIQKLPLMEALAIEAAKAGARVAPLFATTDRIQRSSIADVSEEYLGQPAPAMDWLKNIDVLISTGDTEDSKAVLEGIPESKLAKASRSADAYRAALNHSKLRYVYIGVPNRKDAEYARVDWATYQQMQWDAINADYKQIADQGDRLAKILENAKSVRITSPSGTDLTVVLGNRKAFLNVGILEEHPRESGTFMSRQASLPGGDLIIAPMESSANGRVFAPKDTCRPYEYLTGATYEFKNGKMVSFNAKGNPECFEQDFAAYGGDKDRISSLQIGLNPALKIMEDGSDYRPADAAGMVYIGLGNNQLLGGNNKTEFFWIIPVVKASVEVDGKAVLKEGKLVF
jgi:leucyl aminopeptidase (aminopeptidase T)